MNNPRIYEINTRVWIKQFGADSKLCDIPDDFIKRLSDWGMDALWLMGIWNNNPETIEEYCFEPSLVAAYNNSMPDWNKKDVIGSPYSIDNYEVNTNLGTKKDLLNFKQKLNDAGIKLVLDFIPNHFSSYSNLLKTNPGIFLPADHTLFRGDGYTFFQSPYDQEKYFAHGRDPLFPPWKDTAQINFFSEEARMFFTEILKDLITLCDGVRCDMAMLPLTNVFYNTWVGVLKKYGIEKPDTEFWTEIISSVKKHKKDFFFIAEAYWDLEWNLQQLGFDYTYDKRLTDRLGSADLRVIKDHLTASMNFQKKSVRFIENHDEERAAGHFGKDKSLSAATLISTIPGMILYHDGQFEGRKIKLPVQLGRLPDEKFDKRVFNYYEKLLEITRQELFRKGEWKMMECFPVSPNDYTNENLFACEWSYKQTVKVVAVNYSGSTARCRLKINISSDKTDVTMFDELNNVNYKREISEITGIGLFVELKAFSSHIFSVKK